MSDSIHRRKFLKLTGAGAFGLGLLRGSAAAAASLPSEPRIVPEEGFSAGQRPARFHNEPFHHEYSWSAEQLWHRSTSNGLIFTGNRITLEDQILVEDDAPGIGTVQQDGWETIEPGTVLRKELLIERWPPGEAILTMMVYPLEPEEPYRGAKLAVRINGNEPVTFEVGHVWTSLPIRPDHLNRGMNVVEVTVAGEQTRFRMPVALSSNFRYGSETRRAPRPQRSSRSGDNGESWSHGLTPAGDKSGEYPIRLKLRSYRQRGWLQSPVIDLTGSEGPFLTPATVESASIAPEISMNSHGTLEIWLRSGQTSRPEAGGWSDWERITGRELPERLLNRSIQLRFEISSDSGLTTPEIHNLGIESRVRPHSSAARNSIYPVDSTNRPIVDSSFDFQHEDPGYSRLQEFRRNHRLDDLVEGSRSEMERILRLRNWTAGRWEWFMPNSEVDSFIEWDSFEILAPDTGGFCVYYAILFAQACQSFGIPARIVTINYSVWGGHEVAEVWSREYDKWIMIDPQFDTMFVSRESGEPLNVLELHKVFLETYYPGGEIVDRDAWTTEDRDRRSYRVDPNALPIRMEIGGHALSGELGEEYIWWRVTEEEPAPGYAGGYGFFNTAYLRWLPRSNWMSRPLPMPIDHGRTHWGWDGYLAWTGPQTPETPEHRHFVRRKSDMYGQLYGVDFTAEPIEEGVLLIRLATDSPGFSHYELIDGRDRAETGEPTWHWELAPGPNRLEIRTVDLLGNRGPASELTVNFIP